MSNKQYLHRSNVSKNDEFYTQFSDVEQEVSHYRDFFSGKTVYCNCDDPYQSEFFRYFVVNFNSLGLKKLIATSLGAVSTDETPWFAEVVSVPDTTLELPAGEQVRSVLSLPTNRVSYLEGTGDFRSPECKSLLAQCDVVVTNPPFSLFREFVAQLISSGKKFLVLGNQNAITYKEIYPLIMNNTLWLGYHNGGTKWFKVPYSYDYTITHSRVKFVDGERYHSLGSVYWFTNIELAQSSKGIDLTCTYSPDRYPKYDNDDAIEVSKYKDIPRDYAGTMGVPITFLQHYNPDQFEIVKFRKGADDKDLAIDGQSKYFRIVIRQRDPLTTTPNPSAPRPAVVPTSEPSTSPKPRVSATRPSLPAGVSSPQSSGSSYFFYGSS